MTGRIVTQPSEIAALLRPVKRVAVLGIRGEASAGMPTHYVPAYLASVGLTIVPVPVYEPNLTHILNQPVVRQLRAIEGHVDLVDVFRRPDDIDAHVDDLIALHPDIVWFQAGIRNDAAARRLADAGITVVQDRCLMVDYRNLVVGA